MGTLKSGTFKLRGTEIIEKAQKVRDMTKGTLSRANKCAIWPKGHKVTEGNQKDDSKSTNKDRLENRYWPEGLRMWQQALLLLSSLL